VLVAVKAPRFARPLRAAALTATAHRVGRLIRRCPLDLPSPSRTPCVCQSHRALPQRQGRRTSSITVTLDQPRSALPQVITTVTPTMAVRSATDGAADAAAVCLGGCCNEAGSADRRAARVCPPRVRRRIDSALPLCAIGVHL